MNSDRWQEVKEIFNGALECAPEDRSGYLEAACRGDDDLRGEVESLLASLNESGSFMKQPAVSGVADMIVETQTQLRAGERVGRYLIRQPIGAGGMGEVYLASDLELEREIALKVLAADVAANQQAMQRFIREAKSASALNHPNIITIYEVGLADGRRFIAAEFIKGETLRQRLRRGRLSLGECLEISVQIASALSAAHEAKVVHRDIKPENIMLRPDGVVKVLDFGLAKLTEKLPGSPSLDSNAPTQVQIKTAPGMVMGTAYYMSPEQARGREVDLRSDIWSLGVVLYEMLTGRLPFSGETPTDVMASLLKDEPAALATQAPDAPTELQRITRKALRKDPDERYQNVKDLLLDLKTLQRELEFAAEKERSAPFELASATTTAKSSGEIPPTQSKPRPARLPVKAITAGAGVLIVIAVVLAYGLYLRRPSATLTSKDTILITDFNNSTGDPVFDDTLKQGLALQLQQSSFLNIFPNTKVRETLRQMERKQDERVTVEIGREICQRNDLKALIAGSIAALGSHYVITLEAINARSGEEIARQQAEAESKEQVLKSLSAAASGIREKLGESLSSIRQSDIPLYQWTTTSLEALQSFALGFDRSNKGEYFTSIPLFKHAVDIDPNFAYGYSLVAGNYIIMGEPRRAAENAAKAFALKDKVSDREQLYITYVYDNYSLGDVDKAVETLRLYDQSYPHDFRASGNLSLAYQWLGQFDKSYAAASESVKLNPEISAWQVTLGIALIRLERFTEARAAFQRAIQSGLDDPRMHAALYQLAFIDRDVSAMQQQLDWARGKPEEFFATDLETAAAAYQGRWRQSQQLVQQAVELSSRVDFKEVAARFAAEQGLRAAVIDQCDQAKNYSAQSLALDRNQVTMERIALSQVLCGAPAAQSAIDELARDNPNDTIVNRVWLPMIRGAVELKHGNAARSLELLDTIRAYEGVGEFWPQYLRGEAYLKMNKTAEAAAEFQAILDHRGLAPLSILYPLADCRLAEAAATAGDKTSARNSYEKFFAEWSDADKDLPFLREAQKRYAAI